MHPISSLFLISLATLLNYSVAFDVRDSKDGKSTSFLSPNKPENVHYQRNVLSKDEFTQVQKEVTSYLKFMKPEDKGSIALKRVGTTLPRDSATVRILQGPSLQRVLQRYCPDYILSSDLSVDIRSYEQVGAGMPWHVDDVLYDIPQVEFLLTVENTSDCQTLYKQDDEIHALETEPNSLVLLRAGGAQHCVTSLQRGRRVIVKGAWIHPDAVFDASEHRPQFTGKKRK